CYRNSLALAFAQGLQSIAFPAISCGVYGYPHAEAARIAVDEVAAWLADKASVRVTLVAFDAPLAQLLAAALANRS
ncbi:MAG TPA: macro domain-containing protein, partial [Polyangiales bacterium]|nr:macro domain-containing protein [Polyangiales bacterium]